MIHESDRKLIDDYFAGRLTEEEQRAFEARIARDEGFRRVVMAEKKKWANEEARATPKAEQRLEGRNKVFSTNPVQPEVAPHSTKWWLIAAGVALFAAVAIYFYQAQEPVWANSGDLAAQYFEPLPLSRYTVATEGEEQVPAAFEAYRDGDYGEAVARFQASQPAPTTRSEYALYYSLSLLGNGQGEEAIPLLQTLATQPNMRNFSEIAEWYLALAYLQSGQEESGINQLQEIANNSGHEKQQEAAALLDRWRENQ